MIQFTTLRLTGRAFAEKDQDACLDILTDPVVARTYMLPEYETREAAIPLFQRLMALSYREDRLVVGICLEDHLIGWINDTEQKDGVMEVGYVLHSAYHNRGYMSEALSAVIGQLFAKGYCRIMAGAFQENPASIRVMEKCGMTRLDVEDEVEYRGVIHRCVYYSIENQDLCMAKNDSMYEENSKSLSELVERVQRMEHMLDTLQQAYESDPMSLAKDPELLQMRDSLARYMESGKWLRDYEADERGELPSGLKRGVLSQDTLYDFLQETNG